MKIKVNSNTITIKGKGITKVYNGCSLAEAMEDFQRNVLKIAPEKN